MEKVEIAIGRLLLIGVLISLFFIISGGILYLFKHGNDLVHFHTFRGEPVQFSSIWRIWENAFSFSALGLIQLGLLILVFVQVLRVALTTWYFIKINDKTFTWISLFILTVLILSLFFKL